MEQKRYTFVFIISFILNIFALTYCIARKILSVIEKNRRKVMNTGSYKHMRSCENKSETQGKRLRRTAPLSIVNLLSSFVSFGMAFDIVISTEISTRPYFTYSCAIELSLSLLLATNLFNVVICICQNKFRQNIALVMRHSTSAVVICLLLYTRQCAVIGVMGLFMTGSCLGDEVLKLSMVPCNYGKRKSYQVSLIIRLLSSFVCILLLPTVMFIIPVSFTSERLFDMDDLAIVAFFLAATFFPIYYAWLLKTITTDFLIETSKVALRKSNQLNHAYQMETQWVGCSPLSQKAGFVRISKTRFIRLNSERPPPVAFCDVVVSSPLCEEKVTCNSPKIYDDAGESNHLKFAGSNTWDNIDLS